MRDKKNRLAIDVAGLIIHNVYKAQTDKQIADALLMDVKEIFDYVS